MGEEFKCGLQRPESPESMRARELESNSLQVVMTPTAPPPPIGRIRELRRGSAAGRWAGSVARPGNLASFIAEIKRISIPLITT